MKHMKYIGPEVGWNVTPGDTALVQEGAAPDVVLVQFDDITRARGGIDLGFGWHEFPAKDFEEVLS